MDYRLDEPLDKDTRNWAMACHLSGLATLCPVPLGSLALASLIWLIKRDDHPYIEDQGRQSINFLASMWLYGFIALAVVWILKIVWIGYLIAWMPAIIVPLQLGGSIWGAIKASEGVVVRYPCAIKFI